MTDEQRAERIVALEELVCELWDELDAATQYDAGGPRGVVYEFADRMREMGIEVRRDGTTRHEEHAKLATEGLEAL